MRNVLFLLCILSTAVGVAQKNASLGAFDSIDSDLGAEMHIIKSSGYSLSLQGDEELLKHIHWTVKDRSLELRSDDNKFSFEKVLLTVYTPALGVLRVSNGGKAIMDASFARLEDFDVTADNEAIVDLSRIEFKTLVANSKNGGQIIYNDPSDPF